MHRRRRNGIAFPTGRRHPSFSLCAENGEISPKQDVETATLEGNSEANVELTDGQSASTKIDAFAKTLLTRSDTLRMSRKRESVTSVGPQCGRRKDSIHLANFANRTQDFLLQHMQSHLAVVLGAPGVGKTALIVRYVTGRFVNEYDPTLEMIYEKTQEVKNVKGMLRIMDTAGSIESCISYIRKAEGIIVVYSINDRYSFETAKNYLRMITEYTSRSSPFDYDLPTILVGNKRELRRGREVSRDEARMVAQEHGCSFVESSAACDRNVKKIFTNLFLEIHRVKEERQRMISSNTSGFVNSVRNFFHPKKK